MQRFFKVQESSRARLHTRADVMKTTNTLAHLDRSPAELMKAVKTHRRTRVTNRALLVLSRLTSTTRLQTRLGPARQ